MDEELRHPGPLVNGHRLPRSVPLGAFQRSTEDATARIVRASIGVDETHDFGTAFRRRASPNVRQGIGVANEVGAGTNRRFTRRAGLRELAKANEVGLTPEMIELSAAIPASALVRRATVDVPGEARLATAH